MALFQAGDLDQQEFDSQEYMEDAGEAAGEGPPCVVIRQPERVRLGLVARKQETFQTGSRRS